MLAFVIIIALVALLGISVSYVSERASSGELFDAPQKKFMPKTGFSSAKQFTQAAQEYYELNFKEFNRGMDATTSKAAKSALVRLEDGYALVKDQVPEISAVCYEEDIAELRSWVEDLVYEEWEEKSENTIYQFLDLYFQVLALQPAEAAKAAAIKSRCITKLDSFCQFSEKMAKENKRYIDPAQFRNRTKEMLRNLYDECAVEHSPLPQHIVFGSCDSLSFIRQQFIKNMDGYIASIVAQTKKTVAEEKPSARMKNDVAIAKPIIKTMVPTTYAPLVKYLKSMNLNFVDQSAKGGAVYFFAQSAADHATELGYKVAYAPNGTKGTGHRPAWYARLPR